MKKLFLFIGIIFLFSCEKEPDLHCYKCETFSGDEVISTIITCGVPEDHIRDFEAGIQAQAQINSKCCVKTLCKIKI
jgi:hypothetical protein